MKRGGFKRPEYVRSAPSLPVPIARGYVARVSQEVVVAQPKGEPAKPGKTAPTVAEKNWMDAIVRFGCVACWLDGVNESPAAVHHILRGGRRMGHLYSLSLCDPGHHQNGQSMGLISRHPWKAQFEARYGTESELLAMLRIEIQKRTGVNYV